MAETKTFTICLRAKVDAYVREMVKLGLYGDSRTEVAQRLIEEGIRQALADGLIEVKGGRV